MLTEVVLWKSDCDVINGAFAYDDKTMNVRKAIDAILREINDSILPGDKLETYYELDEEVIRYLGIDENQIDRMVEVFKQGDDPNGLYTPDYIIYG